MSDHSSKPKISPLEDGPLKVEGLGSLRDSRGEPVEVQGTIALCRCGASGNKPFCDGSHKEAGFTDAEALDETPGEAKRYEGEEIIIRDNRKICSHAAFCTDRLPDVWRQGESPWIDPDGASAEEIRRVIRACPSGALSWEEEGRVRDAFHDDPEVQVSKDGPYFVRGGIELEGVSFGGMTHMPGSSG